MLGLVLALIVVGIVLSLIGLWFVGIPVAAVAIVLFVLFRSGWRRGPSAGGP